MEPGQPLKAANELVVGRLVVEMKKVLSRWKQPEIVFAIWSFLAPEADRATDSLRPQLWMKKREREKTRMEIPTPLSFMLKVYSEENDPSKHSF